MKKLVASDMSLAGIKKPPAGRPTNCEPSAAGRSWKGGARERADDVFFAIGIKRRGRKADFETMWKGRSRSTFSRNKTKPPRSGGPKPKPSDSGSGLEARSSFNERAMSFAVK